MYLWSTTGLANELKQGTLSQHERFKYYLAFVLLMELGLNLMGLMCESLTIEYISNIIVSVLIVLIGTIWCYMMNGGRDGRDFIDRSVCLFLPISIRLTVLFIIVAMPLYYAYYQIDPMIFEDATDVDKWFENEFPETTTWLDAAIEAAVGIIFYWRLSVHIGRIASVPEESVSLPAD